MTIVAGERAEQTRARYPDSEGYVERDGVRVFYEVYGHGEPTILLPPPWAIVYSRVWKMQIPYLARHFRVVVYDGRGNGRSDRPGSAEAYGEREQAADALAVLDATGTEQAVVVGFSWGGKWSLILAAEHPERVKALCFLGASLGLSREPFPYELYPFDEELDTDEGWAKENRHYWLRDWQGYVEWFFSQCFTEPHSTKHIEDAVGWGLETTAETMILTEEAPELRAGRDPRALLPPGVPHPGRPRRRGRRRPPRPGGGDRGSDRRPAGHVRRLRPLPASP